MSNRLESLDWLRGMMALSILLFHLGLFGYLDGPHDASTVLGKLGIYGVSIFFILSGLSMAIAYDKFVCDFRSSVMFLIRRLFRIWPLLWLAIALVAIPAFFDGKPYSIAMLGINATTLFGFTFPHLYINMGAWSIGNEMVYYALTPLLIAAYRRSTWLGNAITVATMLIGVIFAFHILTPSENLDVQWRTYINPFNNLFLYCLGLAIYYNFKDLHVARRWHWPMLVTAITLLFIYPSSGDQIAIVTGFNRLALSAISVLIVLAFYKFPPALHPTLSKPLEQVGIATYGVYLLHPIVINWTHKAFEAADFEAPYLFAAVVIAFTIGFSLLTFKYLELPLIKMGKRITRITSSQSRVAETPA